MVSFLFANRDLQKNASDKLRVQEWEGSMSKCVSALDLKCGRTKSNSPPSATFQPTISNSLIIHEVKTKKLLQNNQSLMNLSLCAKAAKAPAQPQHGTIYLCRKKPWLWEYHCLLSDAPLSSTKMLFKKEVILNGIYYNFHGNTSTLEQCLS